VKIRWLDQAVADLVHLRNFIAQDNPDATPAVARSIRDAVGMLAAHPAAGRSGRVPNTRELVITGTAYILPYRVRGGTVEILRVLHSARKWPKNL
jgi:toxin ParE1/3/4